MKVNGSEAVYCDCVGAEQEQEIKRWILIEGGI